MRWKKGQFGLCTNKGARPKKGKREIDLGTERGQRAFVDFPEWAVEADSVVNSI